MYEPIDTNTKLKTAAKYSIILIVAVISVIYFVRYMSTLAETNASHTPHQFSEYEMRFLNRIECERARTSWERALAATPLLFPSSPSVLNKRNVLHDFEYLMTTIRGSFPYLGFAYRQLGIELDVLESRFLEAIYQVFEESTTGNIHYRSFLRVLDEEIIRHFGVMGHLRAISPNHNVYGHFGSMPLDERIVFESIEANNVAYMSIASFLINDDLRQEASDAIHNFYLYIANYEHLIIDIRENAGGNVTFFFYELIQPLMIEDYTHITFSFATDLRAGSRWVHDRAIGRFYGIHGITAQNTRDILPMDILLENHGHELIYLHPGDKATFNYGFRNEYVITAPRSIDENGYEVIKPIFTGKVWLLIDRGASATVEIAHRIKDMGMPTLVGNTTGWATGRGRAYEPLPISRIILSFDALHMTDRHGRSNEYGIDPHIFCDDPLATVLQLIASGEYIKRPSSALG
ncbi:MAG: S41 family peptidase [Defluviitaleaceae bacterium]|nr:S41 family peptidase [Defluviitaleaceae bacterium]